MLSPEGRSASLRFGARGTIARIECSDGAWYLKKGRLFSPELIIESEAGGRLGWYRGRSWLADGAIQLSDDIEVQLRHWRPTRWRLRLPDSRPLAEFSTGSQSRMYATTFPALGDVSSGHMLVLSACAVLVLGRDSSPTSRPGGGL